ncbi:sodium/potassium-transporting ATPase subunit alpha [Apis mellifera caucasica]|uniref:Sodium/potassium-transporting ATPase subunit alpha n=1 Tax=Apis mellifera TaxID=7460 RepID=A0A7M7R7I4_APIME|nr:sodium/potassium-transporting ATPase subunit alpha [Apis mellifera]KAG6798721.1 sodium/potassium-transporting ATPase subunit alpha [Apis mellifera caucasica]KAG9427831.1 sodium/potassium-transporting ATPase subunit alpha [Apis mellifera carnica]|eukprot:XP_394389.3 sodium/potassium-transporting ATPase subunit alpha [Apis mellifera]
MNYFNIYRWFSKQRRRANTNLESLRRDIETDIHLQPLEDLLQRLETDATHGLSMNVARARLAETGPNTLTPPKKPSSLLKFLRLCFGGFSSLIWVGVILCLCNYLLEHSTYGEASNEHLGLSIVLVILILVTAMFSHYQESKSNKIIESFQQMLPQKTKVLRDGQKKEVFVAELVVGDIVLLETGERVPADIRILECQGLKVDHASITGESIPLLRTANIIPTGDVLQAKNMVFFTTDIVEGSGKGVIVARGDHTVMGRIAKLTSKLAPRQTPLSRELQRFMKLISCWAIFLGMLFFTLSTTMGYTWIQSITFLLGIIVANVPEGLIATMTVSLTLTANKMASKDCMVKHLEAIETLGCTAVICSDKTGTLTQNKMTVRHMWYSGQLREVMISDTWRKYIRDAGFNNLARVASLCNRAEWEPLPEGIPKPPISKRKILGDASDAALLKCMEVLVKGGAESYRKVCEKIFEIPFNSTDKFQANVYLCGKRHVVFLKGAPERVLERCSTVAFDHETRKLDDEIKDAYTESCYVLANNGERVLGFADLDLPVSTYPPGFAFSEDPLNFPLNNLRLIGLISMMDPPRPTVPDAVYKCRCAGIKVIMVTGDHPDTARAIAKYVGIITDDLLNHENEGKGHSIVVTGMDLRDLEPDELDRIIRRYPEIVFARTSPVQKLQIVESCQRLHLITAVTGDGVNDAPALKKADIGIAMGIAGSDVSKEVADLILLNDDFASIVTGIEEGRRLFDNLKSSIGYTLASNVPEILPFLAFILLGIPLPVGVICILCIDLGTDMWPAISLAYEKSESDIMLRKPRIPLKDHLVSRSLLFMSYGQIGIIEACAGFFTYFVVMAEHGFLPYTLLNLRSSWDCIVVNDLQDSFGQEWTYEQRKILEYTCHTAFFVSIVIVQVADVMICKTRRNSLFRQGMNNWVLNFGIIFELVVACVVCYAPYMDVILRTYPLLAQWWLPGIPYALIIFTYDELRKLWVRKNPEGWWDRETCY